MKLNIQSVGFSAHQQLLDFLEQKITKLTRFEDQIAEASVILKLGNGQEDRKEAEITLVVKGDELFASKQADSFEEAADLAIDALKKQIEKRKGKQRG